MQLQNMNTFTEEDYIDEDINEEEEQSRLDCILKYMCYPIYLFSFAEGRLHYLFSYVAFFLMIGSMWLLSNSSYYFTYHTKGIGFSIITIAISILLAFPTCKYYVKISSSRDYDFVNIFLQGAILKSVLYGITITIVHFSNF